MEGDVSSDKVDAAMKIECKAVACFEESGGGSIICHLDIPFRLSTLYRVGRVHLSCWGQDLWHHSVWLLVRALGA